MELYCDCDTNIFNKEYLVYGDISRDEFEEEQFWCECCNTHYVFVKEMGVYMDYKEYLSQIPNSLYIE